MRGFSLVELLIGIAIMGILFAIGAPTYRVWIENSKTRNAAEAIQTGLMLARSEAVKRNASASLQLAAGLGSGWVVGCVVPTATCPATIQDKRSSEGTLPTIEVSSAAGRTIVFNNLGRMIMPAVAPPATSIDINVSNTVVPVADRRNLRVNVGVGGTIRLCDPSVALTDARACQ
jgi:type IV fimbrial biogenesis protein FimT